MKKFIFYGFFLIGILPLFSGNRLYVQTGGNIAFSGNEPETPGMGIFWGVSKDWKLYKAFFLRTDMTILNSETILRNRSVQSSYSYIYDEIADIDYYDIYVRLQYLDIPILLMARMRAARNLTIELEAGFIFNFLLKDGSNATRLRSVEYTDLSVSEQQAFRFDYRFTLTHENGSYAGNLLCPTLGVNAHFSRFRIGLRYQRVHIAWVASIVTDNIPLHILNLNVGYQL